MNMTTINIAMYTSAVLFQEVITAYLTVGLKILSKNVSKYLRVTALTLIFHRFKDLFVVDECKGR